MSFFKSLARSSAPSFQRAAVANRSSTFYQATRNLHIHEYQAQQLMNKYGVKVPNGDAATTVAEAVEIAEKIGTNDFILKAQILAGGRGKGTFLNGYKGGVHSATSIEEVKEIAHEMLGNRLVTKQTGSTGQLVNKILVAQRHFIRREAYFAILLDRKLGTIVIIASRFGGMDIETVAAENPHAVQKFIIKLDQGITQDIVKSVTKALGFPATLEKAVGDQVSSLYKMFVDTDSTQVEVNPLVETSDGQVLCVDAKINFDDNASFRQKEIFAMRDYSQEDYREVRASQADLNFISLDGNIGCLVNGAGLAMATMDIIKLEGGAPANFLDVGGGATEKQVSEALQIIVSDPNVKAILVNIFGGIMRCDVIALGILNAVKSLDLRVPLVVRLSGTNVKEAQRLLDESAMKVIAATDLADAAEKVVKVANIMEMAQEAELRVSFQLPL